MPLMTLLATSMSRRAGRVIIEEKQRLGALHDHVVGTHGDQVDADGRVPAGVDGQAQFGADPIGARHQHRSPVARGNLHQGPKSADSGEYFRALAAPDDRLDALDQCVPDVNVDAGVAVGVAALVVHAGSIIGRVIVAEPMRHLPNIICLCRIALIWPIVDALLGGSYERTLLLFAVAAASDGLDGWLAKRYGWTSRLGKWLDPLADKLLLVSVFLVLTWLGLVPRYLAVGVGESRRPDRAGRGGIPLRLGPGARSTDPVEQDQYRAANPVRSAGGDARGVGATAGLGAAGHGGARHATVLYSGVAYLREFTLRALHVAAQS